MMLVFLMIPLSSCAPRTDTRFPDSTLFRYGERRGAGPFRQRTRARTAGRVLLVGDASGYVDALTGEGLRVGFAQASAAIGAIVAADPARYEREWRGVTRDFRILTAGLVAWAGSPLRGGTVPAAARAPEPVGAVVERLARWALFFPPPGDVGRGGCGER